MQPFWFNGIAVIFLAFCFYMSGRRQKEEGVYILRKLFISSNYMEILVIMP